MAKVIACRACGGKVSAQAKQCPQCGHPVPKGTSLGTWIVTGCVGLVVLSCVGGRIAADHEQAERDANAKDAAARVAQQQAVTRNADVEKCKAEMPAMKAQYTELWGKGKYSDAARTIRNCDALTGDPELKRMVALGVIKEQTLTARDSKAAPDDRVAAINVLKRDYPNDVGDLASLLPTLEERVRVQKLADEKRADAAARARKRKEGVTIGMSEEEVVASSWGRPRKVNRTTFATHTDEQWVYDGGYLYFRDGTLTSIQN